MVFSDKVCFHRFFFPLTPCYPTDPLLPPPNLFSISVFPCAFPNSPGPGLPQHLFLLSLGHLPSYLGFYPHLHTQFYVHSQLGSAHEREHAVFVFQFYLG